MGSAESFIDCPFNLGTVYLGLSSLMLFGDYWRFDCLGGRVLLNVFALPNDRQSVTDCRLFDEFMFLQASGLAGLALLAGVSGYEDDYTDGGKDRFLEKIGFVFFVVFAFAALSFLRDLQCLLRSCANPMLQCLGQFPCATRECVFKPVGCTGLFVINLLFAIWFAMYAFTDGPVGDMENKIMFGLIMVAALYVFIDFMSNVCDPENACTGGPMACCAGSCTGCCEEVEKPAPGYQTRPVSQSAPVGQMAYSPVIEQPQPVVYGNQPMPQPPMQGGQITYGPTTAYSGQPQYAGNIQMPQML